MSSEQQYATCRVCGGLEIFEDGHWYCISDCEISGSGDGEASGPEPAS